jgi:hypothetical protein
VELVRAVEVGDVALEAGDTILPPDAPGRIADPDPAR